MIRRMDEIYDEADAINADPIRVPWRKSCAVCIFRTSNPQDIDDETLAELKDECRAGMDFYCLHQVTEDGYQQPCAGANALYQGAR